MIYKKLYILLLTLSSPIAFAEFDASEHAKKTALEDGIKTGFQLAAQQIGTGLEVARQRAGILTPLEAAQLEQYETGKKSSQKNDIFTDYQTLQIELNMLISDCGSQEDVKEMSDKDPQKKDCLTEWERLIKKRAELRKKAALE